MRYRDIAHFRTRHEALADLLVSNHASTIPFLVSMREAVQGRKNITPKMITAMKKFVKNVGDRTFTRGDRWDSVEVEITGETPNKENHLNIVRYYRGKPSKARLSVNPRQFNMCADRLAALSHGETISAFIRGAIVWVSKDERFPILDVEVESISTVQSDWFKGLPLTDVFAPTGTSADTLFDPADKAAPARAASPPPPPPPTMRERLLPDFSKWTKARAFVLS